MQLNPHEISSMYHGSENDDQLYSDNDITMTSPFDDNGEVDITRSTEPCAMGASCAKQQ